MQKQLNKIITYLHHNLLKIEGNCEIKRDYPGIIKNKIQTETSGRVKLNTSKHDRFRLKALKDEKRKLEEKLANNIKKLEEMEMRSNGGALERKNYNIARNKLGREIETIKSRLEIIDFEFTRFRRKIKKGNAYERSKNEHYPKNIDDLI